MFKGVMLALSIATLISSALPAQAQTIVVRQRDKVTYYTAPPQIQITDERPVVHDFREGEIPPQLLQLPPGPRGYGSTMGGGGGALGADRPGTIGGAPIQIAGNGPGYRNFNPGTVIPLDKADYNHAISNIPARGIHPYSTLPNGYSTGVHTRMAAPMMANAIPSSGLNPLHTKAAPGTRTNSSAATYGPGYTFTDNVGGSNGSAHATTSVSLKMLNMLNKVR